MADVPPILLIDKPPHMTSFGVVARVRRITGVKKAGHAGTLDPLATGLMIIGLGEGTKQLATLTKLDKEYEASILIGQSRTTGDMDGELTAERPVTETFSTEKLSSALESLCGELTLPVSGFSAIKVDGVPMYKRAYAAAERGEPIPVVPERKMQVHAVTLLGVETVVLDDTPFPLVHARFVVGSGTYIRSLAEEFGRRLGYPATLYNLRRTRVGDFAIKDALTLEALAKQHNMTLY